MERVLATYANNIQAEAKEEYYGLKEALLEALRMTTEQCRLDNWTMTKKYGDLWQEMAREIDSVVKRMVQGCKTVEEVSNMMCLHKCLSLCFADGMNYANVRHPSRC